MFVKLVLNVRKKCFSQMTTLKTSIGVKFIGTNICLNQTFSLWMYKGSLLPNIDKYYLCLWMSYNSVQNLLSSRLASKNIKIRIYKILHVVLCRCETWSLTLRNLDWGCLRTGCWGEYLDWKEMKWREIGGNCIMRSFITCTPRQT
jgi:hypothetical protein